MVQVKLIIYFQNELENYINDTQKESKKIVLDIEQLQFVLHWTSLLHKYDLENIEWEVRDPNYLHKIGAISQEKLFEIIGSTRKKALEKCALIGPLVSNSVDKMKEETFGPTFGLNCVFEELDRKNRIDKVEIEVIEW